MAIAALVTCAVFSTASGIVGAVVTLMGLLAFPAMANANYNKSFASGVICAGGTLGILIPPSIMLIVYAAIAELSPLRLYAAAVFPGLLLAGMYILYVIARVMVTPGIAPKPAHDPTISRSFIWWSLLTSFVPLCMLIMLVLGTILGGLATPAEAAAMGALGGLVLAALYHVNFRQIVRDSLVFSEKFMIVGALAGLALAVWTLYLKGTPHGYDLGALKSWLTTFDEDGGWKDHTFSDGFIRWYLTILWIAIGAFVGLAATVALRASMWIKVKESVFLTAKATAMVCWMFVGSWTFASVFSYLGGHDVIEDWVLAMDLRPMAVPDPGAAHHLPARLAAGMVGDPHHLRADLPADAAILRRRIRISSRCWSRSTCRRRS